MILLPFTTSNTRSDYGLDVRWVAVQREAVDVITLDPGDSSICFYSRGLWFKAPDMSIEKFMDCYNANWSDT